MTNLSRFPSFSIGLLETAKLNGPHPEAYPGDATDRMVKGHPIKRLAELLPWNRERPTARLAA
jgi:transposase